MKKDPGKLPTCDCGINGAESDIGHFAGCPVLVVPDTKPYKTKNDLIAAMVRDFCQFCDKPTSETMRRLLALLYESDQKAFLAGYKTAISDCLEKLPNRESRKRIEALLK